MILINPRRIIGMFLVGILVSVMLLSIVDVASGSKKFACLRGCPADPSALLSNYILLSRASNGEEAALMCMKAGQVLEATIIALNSSAEIVYFTCSGRVCLENTGPISLSIGSLTALSDAKFMVTVSCSQTGLGAACLITLRDVA